MPKGIGVSTHGLKLSEPSLMPKGIEASAHGLKVSESAKTMCEKSSDSVLCCGTETQKHNPIATVTGNLYTMCSK